ncbi:MAG: chemotaxis protein CheA [Synergistaceae bacterium]|jgi:two-component system chemotaxis sensor kinase CheA|nr:chemotaxis protein CheA [Synergistaceae bacterium]
MTEMDMSQYLGAFLDEAGDNLQRLDDLLLKLEKDATNMDVINEIFRSAHTLKGMSATMGFEKMAGLTHALEDRLDAARKGTHHLSDFDMNLMFSSLDTMQAMVDSIRGGESDAHLDVSELVASLRNMDAESAQKRPEPAPAAQESSSLSSLSQQEKEWIGEANNMGRTVFRVEVILSENCLLKAARAYMVVNRMEELGDVIKTDPSTEALENEDFALDFIIYLASQQNKEEIKNTLLKISDIATVNVEDLKNIKETAPAAHTLATQESAAAAEHLAEHPVEHPKEKKPEPAPVKADAHPAQAAAIPPKPDLKKANQTVRVDIGRLDKLMNLVGELVIGRARIERLVQEARLREFDDPLSQLGRISGDIQELVTKLRMVPVSFTFDRFPRIIRDISKNLGKDVELVLEGQDTELDRTVIDEIGDPMVHLIRNSLDHGIETREERRALGKPEKGILKISAYQEGSGVIIEVTDDGKGIDPEKVKRKAVERGIIDEDDVGTLSDEEAIQIVLLPGFSLAPTITDISGRGVGMDAVKTKVEALGGQLDLVSKMGQGTSVYVRLPLTLAIVLSLLIKVGDETYAISLENVEETILVKRENIKTVHGAPATLLRGEVLSLSDLGDVLRTSVEESQRDEYPVVVVKIGKNKIGFIVSELIGQQEIVIKSLGRFLSKIKGIAGATILGDGNVALILDVASLYTTKG